ncbi:cytochrome P450 [Xenococcus sp. PCC 7305]|uniref:cytochrome P450 n=1 Tax=Xenococcus sp. PCC 7305 TaxID=102125 RepID=UPI0002DBC548|nr:cytochrome P450 [Xenococcus sp. PCC 7305]
MSPDTLPKVTPSFLGKTLNNFQAWALEKPDNLLSKIFLPPISFIEGMLGNNPVYLDGKRQALGLNFCCAGEVVLGEFPTLETTLTSPQARTWRLGTTMLSKDHAAVIDDGGRNVFLISLSDSAAGGQDHSAFRKCMNDYLINDAAIARQQDPTAQKLLENLATDYLEMPHSVGEAFFTDDQKGWMVFMVRYLHYVLFGIDPEKEEIAILTNLHYTKKGTLHYFAGSSILEKLKIAGFGELPELIEQVADIYENSPALANFSDNNPEYNNMTRRELAKLMVSVMSIAGLQGPLHLGRTAMGYQPLPAYQGRQTNKIDVTAHWDSLDLDDREAIKLFLLECGRLFMPVSASHRVATEPFTVNIAGKERTFPTGTKILIPMLLGMLSEDFWGTSAYSFNPQRENLCPFHMGFNSVGDRTAGRICPGKAVALEMLIDVISTVGKARRTKKAET